MQALPMLATGLSAAGTVFTGVQAMNDAKAQKQQAEINSFIGKTRAIQTDTQAREGLNMELAEMRAAVATAGEAGSGTGTLTMYNALKAQRERERRIGVGNEMQVSADYRNQAASINPGMYLLGGALKAAPSIYDMYQLGKAA